jgi:hypothetical protein
MWMVSALEKQRGIRCILGLQEAVCTGERSSSSILMMKILPDNALQARLSSVDVHHQAPLLALLHESCHTMSAV